MRGIRVGVRALALGGFALTFFASGCSSGGGGTHSPASCLQVQPCGGDIVGTWKLLGGCINAAAISDQVAAACPGASVAASIDVTGTATFNADLTYTFDVAEMISETQSLPLSCTGLASCTELQDRMMADNPDGTVTCSGVETCACHTTISSPTTTITGTYAISGTTVVQSRGASTTTNGYCVQGDMLHLMAVSATTGQVLIDDVAQKL
jgi:hypothetical protein